MAVKAYTKENQANGNFNGGEILEKKPIGFPQDGGMLRPTQICFTGLTLGLQRMTVL